MKTLRANSIRNKDKFNIPKTVQQAIPMSAIWDTGVARVGKNKYAKSYKFSDINYAVASNEDKVKIIENYSSIINGLDSGAENKLTIIVRRLNHRDFENKVLLSMRGDDADHLREEYNRMILKDVDESNGMTRELYITITVCKKNINEAQSYFNRTSSEFTTRFAKLGSRLTDVSANNKLRILHDFYRAGEEELFEFNLSDTMRKGHDIRDYISPDSFEINKDYLKIGDRFCRVLYFKDVSTFLRDDFIAELNDINKNVVMSIDITPIPTDEAVREVESKLLGVETDITNWQQKQNRHNNFSAFAPPDLVKQRKECTEFLEDITSRDQRMTLTVFTLAHTADSKEQLDSDTDTIITIARKRLCQFATLKYQQLDGLNTALPIGVRKINVRRTLTTESLCAIMPFRAQEIMDGGGSYYGRNLISKNLIMCNKALLQNQGAFVFGIPGCGKSFSIKEQITFLALSTDDDILICDPDGEYPPLVRRLNGGIIQLGAGSDNYVNPMDMTEGYGEHANSIADKTEFLLSLLEQLDKSCVTPRGKSIVGRCIDSIYKTSKNSGDVPTLVSLRELLLKQPEKEAQDIALVLELFTTGSLDVFAHETNVDTKSRIIDYDLYNLGEQLRTMGLLVVCDAILNRVTDNDRLGKRTHVFIDEFHVIFENEHSGKFFCSAWRRWRKRNACPTAITQNIEYVLNSDSARLMLANSEFVVMLNQAPSDRDRLADLFNISNEQLGFITDAAEGKGLIKYGNAFVPFENKFPKDTELYKLMSTKPNEIY
ncbi:MAG: TraE family protein [Oscillospiraceae bacterium]